MDSEKILRLLARQMGKIASEDELNELKGLLESHPDYHIFKEIVQSIEGERLHAEPVAEEDELVKESWSLLMNEMDSRQLSDQPAAKREKAQGKSIPWKRLYIAAALAGLILISGLALFRWPYRDSQRLQVAVEQLSVPYGMPKKMILPDSSVIWLNAGSHIRYADNFAQNDREVYLEGEAYFNVKHDAKHPFLVHAGNIVIEVLGTEFNVQAYYDEDHIETTLIKGKVQVQIAGKPDKKIVLTSNEKLTVINENFSLSGKSLKERKELSFKVQEVVPLQTTTPIPEVAWLQDKLAFQNEPFAGLAKKLERRYDVHIVFKDSLLEKERLSGVFENETIQKALTILQMTTPFQYKIQDSTVYIKEK